MLPSFLFHAFSQQSILGYDKFQLNRIGGSFSLSSSSSESLPSSFCSSEVTARPTDGSRRQSILSDQYRRERQLAQAFYSARLAKKLPRYSLFARSGRLAGAKCLLLPGTPHGNGSARETPIIGRGVRSCLVCRLHTARETIVGRCDLRF